MSTPKNGGSNLPPVQLPAVTNGQQLSAVAKAARPLRALNGFAGRADDLSWFTKRAWKSRRLLDSVCRCPWSADAQKALDEAGKVLDLYDSKYRELAEQLKLDRQHFNPADAYDDDEDESITEERVHMHISLLLASFPNANPGNAEAYLGAMVQEVMEAFPSVPALESACSQIRRTLKFPPTTAEVIEAIDEQNDLWSERFMAIADCATCAESLRTELKIATELVAAEQVKREEQRLAAEEKKRLDDELARQRAQKPVVGDRVQNSGSLGAGTAIKVNELGYVTVRFDETTTRAVRSDYLKRLIPGDDGFDTEQARRSQRPTVGDRVSNEKLGAGTILQEGDFESGEFDDGFTVRFDDGSVHSGVEWEYLTRLLSFDDGFDCPAVPMIEHKPTIPMDIIVAGAVVPICAVSCEEATTLAPHSHNSTGVAAARSGAVSHEQSNQTEKESK